MVVSANELTLVLNWYGIKHALFVKTTCVSFKCVCVLVLLQMGVCLAGKLRAPKKVWACVFACVVLCLCVRGVCGVIFLCACMCVLCMRGAFACVCVCLCAYATVSMLMSFLDTEPLNVLWYCV